jgi:hypothetical protein
MRRPLGAGLLSRYLARVDAAMDTLKRRLGEQPITLLSHSVGAAACCKGGQTAAGRRGWSPPAACLPAQHIQDTAPAWLLCPALQLCKACCLHHLHPPPPLTPCHAEPCSGAAVPSCLPSSCLAPGVPQAGGWLGRVYMLDFGTAGIDRFVTLGSPHNPPPAGAAGVVDQTRGILTFCQDACPGAFHDEVGVAWGEDRPGWQQHMAHGSSQAYVCMLVDRLAVGRGAGLCLYLCVG